MSRANPVEQIGENRLVFEESTEVKAPIADVYRRWTDFTHFPAFMSNVREVRSLGSDRYHWSARIFGVKQEWDAEVTERDPERRVSWRSVNGAYNSGTVSLSPLPTGDTEVRVRLEYSPPGGRVGQQLDKLTQTTRREVREDLTNFKRVVAGTNGLSIEPPTRGDLGGVIIAAAAPLAGAVAGVAAARFLAPRQPQRVKGWARQQNPAITPAVTMPVAAASWGFAGLGLGSAIAAGILRSMGQHKNALFIGQWAPTLAQAGVLVRLLGSRGQSGALTDSASYAVLGAGVGGALASAIAHARGRRYDGLFIGQWVPTMVGSASLVRLIGR
jgi:uncharacterized membrane protein